MDQGKETPRILIASKGMSVDQMRADAVVPERPSQRRNFMTIQGELFGLVNKPDPKKEDELKLERARLLNDAKDIGLFVSVKSMLLEIQEKYPFVEAFNKIDSIDIGNLENQSKGIHGWEDNFEGILEQYRNGALRNMQLAALEAQGRGSLKQAKDLRRTVGLLGWGTPPAGLEKLANPSGQQGVTSAPMDAGEFARAMAREQGLMTPQEYLETYRRAEDFYVPFDIRPGAEPRFWPILTDEKKDQWIVRSTLITAYAKKANATGTENLYLDNFRELGVELNRRALRILFGKNGMDGALPAAGIYTTIIGDENFYKYDEKHINAYNLKSILCNTTAHDLSGLIQDYGGERARLLQEQERLLYEKCPESIFLSNQDSHRSLRESIRFWLVTKGRNLLLTEKELNHKEDFFRDGEEAFKILEERAADAEHVAWEFTFDTSQLEHFDSRAYRPAGSKRLAPSNFWNLYQWMAMHPQERFEQKIARKDFQGNVVEPKEEWAALGTWALNNVIKGRWTETKDGKPSIKFPEILPDVVIRDALHPSRYQENNPDAESESLFTAFNKIGNEALFNDGVSRTRLEGVIDWDKMGDAPFINFNYDEMRWADVVLKVFKKGQGSEVDLAALGEAARNLNFSKKERLNLLIAFFGASPKADYLRPVDNPITWNGVLTGIKRDYPNFFI